MRLANKPSFIERIPLVGPALRNWKAKRAIAKEMRQAYGGFSIHPCHNSVPAAIAAAVVAPAIPGCSGSEIVGGSSDLNGQDTKGALDTLDTSPEDKLQACIKPFRERLTCFCEAPDHKQAFGEVLIDFINCHQQPYREFHENPHEPNYANIPDILCNLTDLNDLSFGISPNDCSAFRVPVEVMFHVRSNPECHGVIITEVTEERVCDDF